MNEATVRSYRPGDWFAIVGERAVVVLPPTEKPRVAALWELVDGGAGFDVTLDALISGGLRELPGFVLVSTGDGETKVVLRGAARAEFVVGEETVHLEGASATTWVERTLSDVSRMSIVLTEDPDPDEDADDTDEGGAELASYVVDGGLFRVSRLDESPDDEPEAYDEPEEVVEPEAGAPEGIDTEPDAEAAPAPMVRSPEPPSWTPPPPPPVVPPVVPAAQPPTEAMASPLPDPDHDGLTVTGSWEPPAPSAPGIPGQEPAPDVTIPVARLVIAGGETIDVDRAIVIGRAPEARRFNETEQPRLVTVSSPQLEISSTHVEIRPGSGADHGSAVVTDLGSTNGTVLVQPGLGPEELSPGVGVQLMPGAVIDLGDGVTIQVTRP